METIERLIRTFFSLYSLVRVRPISDINEITPKLVHCVISNNGMASNENWVKVEFSIEFKFFSRFFLNIRLSRTGRCDYLNSIHRRSALKLIVSELSNGFASNNFRYWHFYKHFCFWFKLIFITFHLILIDQQFWNWNWSWRFKESNRKDCHATN